MSATLTFTFPSSEITLWESRAAALAFFNSLTVPDATTSTDGVVKMATTVSYTVFTAYDTADYFSLDFDGTVHVVVEQATLTEVQTKLLTLATAFNTLLTNLRSAGVLNS